MQSGTLKYCPEEWVKSSGFLDGDTMLPQWIIEKKRDGQALTREEIEYFITGFTRGDIPDYQMSALAMAICFRGMNAEETGLLTHAMMNSGSLLNTSTVEGFKCDKHSTGGIGDKVSIILAPLAAACDLIVPSIAGRGLGISGGTYDKLCSIPGYNADLSEDRFLEVLRRCGCSLIGQTETLVPADKKLYALRDVTATVPVIPLIVSSIMSKKLAEGLDGLVLDVKVGKGAFMRTPERARELAENMVAVGRSMGKKVRALITDMDEPLGRCVGNALEIEESLDILEGRASGGDLLEVTLELGAAMLETTGKYGSRAEAHARMKAALDSGKAREKFFDMVRLHGGDCAALEKPRRLPRAAIVKPLECPGAGFVSGVDAELVGRACLLLGAGRVLVADKIDYAVGISELVKSGEQVAKGQPLMRVHANDEKRLAEAWPLLEAAVRVSAQQPAARRLFLDEVS